VTERSNLLGRLAAKATGLLSLIRDKHLDRWGPGYLRQTLERARQPEVTGTRHVLFTFCDHFEPLWSGPTMATAMGRVERWHELYPALTARFTDADGRGPQHSFFFPGEEYRSEFFDLLDDMVRKGAGEVELHLHHEADTAETLRTKISEYLDLYGARGHLSRDEGRLRYAFIHGNWALANGRPDGRWCGVDAELPLLFDTGCYADFTFPSVPDVTQPGMVNQIYWPKGDLERKRAYERGEPVRVGTAYDDRVLMITGPLAVALGLARRKIGIEFSAVTAHDPATQRRVDLWVQQNIHVAGRPEWTFVKVYTHGAPDAQGTSLLGPAGHAMHEALQAYNDGDRWKLHYVTAREMYNIAKAAMAGERGDPNAFRDYELAPPPIVAETRRTP
jgi:hypothetical protein